MPRGDRTGPIGMGPRTGWGAGYCSGYNTPGFANIGSAPQFGYGRGFGAGRGRRGGSGFGGGWCGGRGLRNMSFSMGQPGGMRSGGIAGASFMAPKEADEKQFLQGQAESLQRELDEIKRRLDRLSLKEET